MSFGDWQGRTAAQVMQTDPERLRQFWSDPSTHAPPGGEPLAQLHERVMRAWQRIVTEPGGERALIVTHSGPIRLLRAAQSGTPLAALLSIEVAYAGLIDIDCRPDGGIVREDAAPRQSSPERG